MVNILERNTVPVDEEERIKALRFYALPCLGSDEAIDNLVKLICTFYKTPIASVSLVDKDRVHHIANVGLTGIQSCARKGNLNAVAILINEILIIEDIESHPLFSGYQIVEGKEIVFYASAPLRTRSGFAIGTVSIADKVSRHFTEEDRECLGRFADAIMQQIELKSEVQTRTKKLEEKEFQLKEAFKMAKVGAWEFDPNEQKAAWSDELYEVYGVDKNELIENELKTYLSLLHPDDLERANQDTANPLAFQEAITERLLRGDGSILHIQQIRKRIFDVGGNLVKVIGISQDITAHVEYEQKLKNSEERFKALVQNSSDMTAVLDEKGYINYISPASFRISGYKPDELVGRNVFDFIHETDKATLMVELSEVAQSINSGEPTLHRFQTKKGNWIWLESKGMNMMNDSNIGGIIINARDVTERKRLEERLALEQQNYQRAITSAVIKAQEMERSELGRELHDNVNQVLTTIKLYTEMIRDGIGDQKELVGKAGQHLQCCIDEIRSISKRLAAPTLGEISLEDSIKELIDSINLTNRIEIIYCGNGMSDLQIPQDMHLAIYRIIQEQLNNILKYAGASLVFITLKRAGNLLSLHITDNGKGFDTTVKRSGIGITNMRTRTENLAGQFKLTSAQDKGCQLHVQFPLKTVCSNVGQR